MDGMDPIRVWDLDANLVIAGGQLGKNGEHQE
jgi:hypothetical protein